jgi:hypothetical protein
MRRSPRQAIRISPPEAVTVNVQEVVAASCYEFYHWHNAATYHWAGMGGVTPSAILSILDYHVYPSLHCGAVQYSIAD